MSPDHITAGAYNRNIDKRLARNMVWLRETNSRGEGKDQAAAGQIYNH